MKAKIITSMALATAMSSGCMTEDDPHRRAKMGAIAGASFGLAFYPSESPLIFPGMILAGAFGGWAWSMIPAILKTRFRTNEILVSLLLVYVAEKILASAAVGFLRNPEGSGFPGSRNLSRIESMNNPELISGTGMHWGVALAFICLWFGNLWGDILQTYLSTSLSRL